MFTLSFYILTKSYGASYYRVRHAGLPETHHIVLA